MRYTLTLLSTLLVGLPTAFAGQDGTQQLLAELSNAHGPSGYEGPVRVIMTREMTPLADRMETDGLGSLIAVLEHSADAPNIMIAAHMGRRPRSRR